MYFACVNLAGDIVSLTMMQFFDDQNVDRYCNFQAVSLTFVKTIEENGNDVIKLLFLELLVQFIFDTVLHACSFS